MSHKRSRMFARGRLPTARIVLRLTHSLTGYTAAVAALEPELSNAMDPKVLLYVTWGAMLAAGTSAQNSQCGRDEFWNSDIGQCVPCSTCQKYPKTPSCETCSLAESSSDVWKLAAITSFSTLAIVLFVGVLLVGILVHRSRSRRKSNLREPVEETTGPLYQI